MTFRKVRNRKNANPVIHLFFTMESTALTEEEPKMKYAKPIFDV